MNGRLYDYKLARFLSPDPFLQDPSNTQNFNRYSYCLNNPFAYTDPSGYVYGGANSNYTPGGNMPFYNNTSFSNYPQNTFHSSWDSDWQDNINNGSINTENICHLAGTGWNIRGSSNGTWSKQYIDLGGLGKIPYYTNSYSGAIRTGFRFTTISNESFTYEWKGKTETYSSTCVGVGWAWLTIMPHYGSKYTNATGGLGVSTIIGAIGTSGDAASLSKSTFRLMNGANGSFSPNIYPNGWNGGSTARITTYSVSKIGTGVSTVSGAVCTYMAYNDIIKGKDQPITWVDAGVGTIGLGTSISSYFTGVKIPYVGGFVAIYGAVRLTWDVGCYMGENYGPSTWYGTNDYKWFK